MKSARSISVLCTKLTTLSFCIYIAISGHFPPLFAQKDHPQYQVIPLITTTDALQNDHIDTLDKRLTEDEAKIAKQWDGISANTNTISGMQGETRGIGIVLGLLSAVQIILQLKRKREE